MARTNHLDFNSLEGTFGITPNSDVALRAKHLRNRALRYADDFSHIGLALPLDEHGQRDTQISFHLHNLVVIYAARH